MSYYSAPGVPVFALVGVGVDEFPLVGLNPFLVFAYCYTGRAVMVVVEYLLYTLDKVRFVGNLNNNVLINPRFQMITPHHDSVDAVLDA